MKILITGAAGFIGFHLAKRFLDAGVSVFGLDNLNDYYSVQLKKDRLQILQQEKNFHFEPIDLADGEALNDYFKTNQFTHVVNLAAQAGVRYSLINPKSYIDSNIVGFANLLECCRHNGTRHLVYASSSSVYGLNTSMPFSVHDNVDHPVSLYAASKKSNELMAHTYSYLYKLPTTGLRFFTVYGPWGRPDMALYLFTKAIGEGKPINVFNHGRMRRDFTYIDDIVEGVFRIVSHVPQGNSGWDGNNPDPSTSPAPYKLYNIGNNNTVELEQFITVLENALGKKAVRNYMDIQPGDVPATYANIDDLISDVGFKPSTSIEEGIEKFIVWYQDYYRP
ncbi:MAG: NAD-dependent epimerase [Desulfomicrobium sp.]|nr:NAD-dependent epimerase [Pseudomonadota bacterium]MBV1712773.1 NAD-dependent epimerase [Desulfomicrobium sp.]MBU4571743.1 NAD-dependent epimerase [Pseudomonadota bacterium]MBU4595892.1 NAD-dependent epimerase [Pseudomonadota bacterium]MBV1721196.1 NAD-dependent epimerase [Desulfomicrobium sp.]